MLTERVPPWYRDDLLVKTVNDETEKVKLDSYFNFNKIFSKQPLQLWPSFRRKQYSFTSNLWNGNNTANIDLSGSYPLNYNFTIETNDIQLVAPANIVSRESTLRINTTLPTNSTIDIDTAKTIRIDDVEAFSVEDQSQNNYETLIELGKTDSNHSLKQEFVPNKPGLKEIEIMFGDTVGNPEDTIIVSICKDDEKLVSKTIKPEEIRRSKGTSIIFGFDLDLIPGKIYQLLLERTGDINLNNYYNLYGSTTLYQNGTLYGSGERDWHVAMVKGEEVCLYFVTKTPPITMLRNLGNSRDTLKFTKDVIKEEEFVQVEYYFGESVGTPTNNLIFRLMQDGKVLESHEISSEDVSDILTITLDSIHLPGDYQFELFLKNSLFDKENFYTLLTFEDLYPTYYPPTDEIAFYSGAPSGFMLEENAITLSGQTVGVELEAIYVKAFAQAIYPLKSVKLYIERENSPDLIEEASFSKTLHQRCFFAEILKENIEVPIPALPLKIYAKVKYWGLQDEKIVGFPVDSQNEDPAYQPNTLIDDIGKGYGIFRREFKENIPYYDYAYTYPIGYPWKIEQDIWYEKRLSDEYATRKDKNDKVILYEKHQLDVADKPLLELITKTPDIHTIRIEVGQIGLDCEICPDEIIQTITFADTNIEGITTTHETFTYDGDIISLVDDINFNSELIEATYLNSTHEALEVGTFFLNTEGTYQNYGLIRSEINQYLGVIPKIKDMSDYCLIWDEKEWDRYVWAGDKWDAGVFELQIPIHKIPKNFKLLSIDELRQIISRCKAFGTYPLPMYSHEILLKTQFETEFKHAEQIIELPEQKFEAVQADMYASVFAQFGVQYGGVEGEHNAEFSFGFNLDFEVARLIDSEILLANGVNTYTDYSNGEVSLTTSTSTDEHYVTSGWSEGSGISWNNTGAIGAIDGNSAYAYRGGSSSDTTAKLSGIAYPQIPNDGRVTGIGVRVNGAHESVSRPPYFNYLSHTMYLINDDVWAAKYQTYNGGGGTYDYWFGWDGDMWGGQSSLPSRYNQGIVLQYDATVDKNHSVWIDGMYIVFWFKRGSGTYVTNRIIPPTLPSGYDVGYWDQIICTDTKPSGTDITYDVFEDIVDRQQITANANQPFGQSQITEVYQSFVPTTSWITGAWVKAGNPAKIGNPQQDVIISIRNPYAVSEDIIARTVVPKEQWTNGAEIFVPFNVQLTPGQTYWLCWWSNGGFDNNNYFQMAYRNQAIYGKMGIAEAGIGWHTINGGNANAWFKICRGNILLSNKTSPINISTLPYRDLRLKANFTTNNPGNVVPKITDIAVKAKVINL